MKNILQILILFFIGNSAVAQIEKTNFNELEYQNVDGKNYTLESQFSTKGLIVIFSCNTCPFVVGNDDFAGWEKDYNKLSEFAIQNEIGLVLVNSNEAKRENDDSFSEMKRHSKEMGYKMKYLVDKNSELANQLGAKTTPHIFFFNAESQLIFSGSIDNSWDSKRNETTPYLEIAIKEHGNGQELSSSSSEPRGCSIKRVKAAK
jgi:thioredoxin-related protein